MSTPTDAHYAVVSNRIKEGKVIPFLGAGANLCDRPDGASWAKGRFLPDGRELATHLAEKSRYPAKEHGDLMRVSQYLDAILGQGTLYEYLRGVFVAEYPPNTLHQFLAGLAPILRAEGLKHQLIMTTNYDTALEQAFDERKELYDLVWYEAKRGDSWGRFLHRAPGGKPTVIKSANRYPLLTREERTVIVKLHGAVHPDPAWDSYVITEDSYIDYLSQEDISQRIPIRLREHMRESHFLFLGYSMSDWNLRVILNRMWGSQPLPHTSWAVQREQVDPALKEIEETLWRRRLDVDPIFTLLNEYVAELGKHVIGSAATQVAQ